MARRYDPAERLMPSWCAAWALLGAWGCSTPAPATTEPQPPTPSTMGVLAAVPELAPLLRHRTAPEPWAGGLRVDPPFPDAVRLAVHGRTVRLYAGQAPDAWVELTSSSGDGDYRAEDDALIARSAAGDAVLLSTSRFVEDLRVLRDASAPTSFDVRLHRGPSMDAVVIDDGRIEVRGPGLRLVTEPAWARGANGLRRAVRITSRADGVDTIARFHVDPTGMTYPIVVDPKWSTSNVLNIKRGAHGQVLLNDGRVFVAGGRDGTSALSSAEIVSIGTASATVAPMKVARLAPIAVTLASGKVLVAGGTTIDDFGSSVTGAQIFDPAAGTWADAAPMNVARASASAVLLSSGKVLVVGGTNTSGIGGLSTSEVYDPVANSWTLTAGSMTGPRASFAMGLLPGGKVAVAGGRNGTSYALSTSELFDTGTGTWSSLGAVVARYLPCGTVLGDGRFFVTGGLDSTGTTYQKSSELLTGTTWAAGPDMLVGREACTATTLADGTAIVVAGYEPSGYGVTSSLFSGISMSAGPSFTVGRFEHAATLLKDGRVLVAGGVVAGNAGISAVDIFSVDKADGTACTLGGECAKGFCVDGFCCDTKCDSACTACSAAKKASGANGVCGAIKVDATDSRCATTSASTCGTTGKCAATGCAFWDSTTECSPASCTGSTAKAAANCPGGGAACPSVTGTTCPAGCSGVACATPDAGADAGGEVGDAGPETADAASDTGVAASDTATTDIATTDTAIVSDADAGAADTRVATDDTGADAGFTGIDAPTGCGCRGAGRTEAPGAWAAAAIAAAVARRRRRA